MYSVVVVMGVREVKSEGNRISEWFSGDAVGTKVGVWVTYV